ELHIRWKEMTRGSPEGLRERLFACGRRPASRQPRQTGLDRYRGAVQPARAVAESSVQRLMTADDGRDAAGRRLRIDPTVRRLRIRCSSCDVTEWRAMNGSQVAAIVLVAAFASGATFC